MEGEQTLDAHRSVLPEQCKNRSVNALLLHPALRLAAREPVAKLLLRLIRCLRPHSIPATHDQVARGVQRVVVLLEDSALAIPANAA
jgi:hypothetical protein